MNNPDLQQIGELITDGERFRALCDMCDKEWILGGKGRVMDITEIRRIIDSHRWFMVNNIAPQENNK